MSKQAIVIINGKGGVGKDTLINAVMKSGVMVFNASSITPIKDMCDGLNKKDVKDLAYRNLLAKVKKAVDVYYEAENEISYTNEYLIKAMTLWHAQTQINKPEYSVLFVHIREPENIRSFIKEAHKKKATWNDKIYMTSLLVRSDRSLDTYGNPADDDLNDYAYDFIYDSKGTIEEDGERFVKCFMAEIMSQA